MASRWKIVALIWAGILSFFAIGFFYEHAVDLLFVGIDAILLVVGSVYVLALRKRGGLAGKKQSFGVIVANCLASVRRFYFDENLKLRL
jgi:hypothetical protein